MKVAAPLAGGFLVYVVGMATALFSLKHASHLFRKHRTVLASALLIMGMGIGFVTLLETDSTAGAEILATDSLFVPTDPANSPMGIPRGIFPGRVVWMWDSAAATWNGSGNWWSDTYTHQEVVDSMLVKSLYSLTGKASETAAWDTLFRYFNSRHGKGNVGYQPGEKIAIKINLVQSSGWSVAPNASFVSPQLAVSLLRQLVVNVGVQDTDITIYDTDRYIPDPIYSKCYAAYPGVHFMGWLQQNGREKYVRDTTIVHWSENLTMEINGGHPGYLPTVVTRAAYIINLANFKAHRYMGLTLCSKNHFGTLSADGPDGKPYQNAPHAVGLHCYTAVHDIYIQGSPEWTFTGRPMGTYNTLVDLMGHRDLGEKTVLFLIDALYAVEGEGNPVSLASRWNSPPFDGRWSSSLFMSQDNIAIESVGLDFIRAEQAVNSAYTYTYGSVDNYLHEGALADNPPSGTFYSPNGDGVRLASLGAHEHWNNPFDKQYSRNLGTGNGIELVSPAGLVTSVPVHRGPSHYVLYQNYPNPFNPQTVISGRWPVTSAVRLAVYDIQGKEVAVLADGQYPAGTYSFAFNGSRLASGAYYYRLSVGGSSETKAMILVK